MATNLSIKNVPEEVVAGLRNRAARNQRSLNAEILHILARAAEGQAPVSLEDVLEQAHRRKPGLDETASRVQETQRAQQEKMARRFEDLWGSPEDGEE